ncbi:hypothetical protein VTJ83DRAFT_5417 [Remersonia thermophila]|uniref:Serine/threonine-protein phosphatase 2A activator n=1 Tax=Remersonia thermophila TaxID=72144 RepID=A0ABR4D6S5_9PEZI
MDPPPPTAFPNSTSTTTATTTATTLPRLAVLNPSNTHPFQTPSKCIHTAADLPRFLSSLAYRDIGLFLLQLNRALCPRKQSQSQPQSQQQQPAPPSAAGPLRLPPRDPPARRFPLDAPRSDPASVVRLRELLAKLEALIDEAPPERGPRRFGNPAFRKWHALLQERAEGLLREHLPAETLEVWGEQGVLQEVTSYFVGAFGSKERLDYGTGHELSFLAFLGGLWKLGAFGDGGDGQGEVERSLVLGVFEPYLQVVRRLILTYTLEPAGSHGVWGLDDHSFLPYIFGSAQLTRPISDAEPMPLEGSVRGAPQPADILKPAIVDRLRAENMYFSAIGFINDVKTGPFWEHSPVLFDISGVRDGWGKINKGMIKMFNAEVLSKFPVVQHFPFGSLFSWDPDPEAQPLAGSGLAAPSATTAGGGPGTAAPWAQATKMPGAAAGVPPGPGIPYTKVPWTNTPRGGGSGTGGAGTRPPGAPAVPAPRGGVPDTGPPPPTAFPRGTPGTASNQFAVTKAPWAKE